MPATKKNNNVIDYTKMRANKKLRLVKCPTCGKTGQLHTYKGGSASITHSGKIVMGMFFEVDKYCDFAQGEYPAR